MQRDGTLLGLRVQIVADLGAYFLLSTPTVPILTSHRLAGPYKTPAMHVEVRGVITNKPPTGAYRGAGAPEAAFCLERTIDLIARDLQLDPAAVRRSNFIPPEAFPSGTPTGPTRTTPGSMRPPWTAPWRCRTTTTGAPNLVHQTSLVHRSLASAWPRSSRAPAAGSRA